MVFPWWQICDEQLKWKACRDMVRRYIEVHSIKRIILVTHTEWTLKLILKGNESTNVIVGLGLTLIQ